MPPARISNAYSVKLPAGTILPALIMSRKMAAAGGINHPVIKPGSKVKSDAFSPASCQSLRISDSHWFQKNL